MKLMLKFLITFEFLEVIFYLLLIWKFGSDFPYISRSIVEFESVVIRKIYVKCTFVNLSFVSLNSRTNNYIERILFETDLPNT